jgi:pyruvate/2-oxoglutarate dehydrogenase complex dihydrolipoamide dehydrogenase (E3) component
LNTEVNPELIEKSNPDAIVIAIGSESVMPEIPGVESPKVATAIEVLRDISNFKKGKAVVTGSGDVSCETACYLADNGFDVTIVGRRSELLEDYGDGNIKVALLRLIQDRDIEVLTGTRPNKVVDEGLEVILPDGKEHCVVADHIVIAALEEQDPDYVQDLSLRAEEFHVIGDCRKIGRIMTAISEGEMVGRSI